MAATGIGSPIRAIPPKGKGQLKLFVVRMVGGTTGAGTITATQSSVGVTFDGASGTTGKYVFTLPGKGSSTIVSAWAAVEDPDSAKAATIDSHTTATRKVEVFVYTTADGAGANLESTETLTLHVLVADV